MASKLYNLYAETDMEGPFPLTMTYVNAKIGDRDLGVYVLCGTGTKGGRIAQYVGRGDLKDRLTAHVNAAKYKEFYFKVLKSDLDGFKEESRLFHKYGETTNLDNEIHPAVPAGSQAKCPVASCKG